MNFLPLILIAFLLSTVPFSVALSSSIYRCIVLKEALRIAFVFALFQAGMMALGWLIGFSIKGLLHSLVIPVAALVIFFIGMKIFLESRRPGREQRTMAVEDRRILLGFGFVISINTAMLSMGLGMIYSDLAVLAGSSFGLSFLMSLLGVFLGKRGMMTLGKTAELLGGAGLIMVSLVIVMEFFGVGL